MKYLLSLFVLLFSSLILADTTFFDDENEAFVMGSVAAASAETSPSPPTEESGGEGGRGSGCALNQTQINGTCMNITAVPLSNETTAPGEQETKQEEAPINESIPTEETGSQKETLTQPVNGSHQLLSESGTGRALFISSVMGIAVMIMAVFVYLWWRQRKLARKIY